MELVKVENGEIVVAQELANKIIAFEKESLKVSYRKASTRTTVDSKKLKEDLPDIYEEYSKTSDVSSSISISVE